MLTASLDDFSIFGADLGAKMAQGDGAETDLCVLLTDWRAGGADATHSNKGSSAGALERRGLARTRAVAPDGTRGASRCVLGRGGRPGVMMMMKRTETSSNLVVNQLLTLHVNGGSRRQLTQ